MWYLATALLRSPLGAALLDSKTTRSTPAPRISARLSAMLS